MLAVYTLWRREVVRFLRQPSRLVGALAQPIVFWLLLGGGLSAAFRPPGAAGGAGYLEYFYPGVLALVLLFTAIFSTISTIEDRRSGFLQGVLVAPVGRGAIVAGQALGGTTLAVLEGVAFLLLAPAAGLSLAPMRVLAVIGVMALVGFGLTSIGLVIAWRMESTQGFHAIMNLILIPIWLLSGAFFPSEGLPAPLSWIMRIDPLTYGLAALRRCLYPGWSVPLTGVPELPVALALATAFSLAAMAAAVMTARRSATL